MMFFVLAVMVFFVVISVYFFLRTEKLQRQLMIQKRESLNTRKENKALVDSMAFVASRFEESAKYRLKLMKAEALQSNNEQNSQYCELISPLINNYSSIFRECLKGKGRLKKISQKCFDNHDVKDFKKFSSMIMQGEKQVKRYWASNNLNGFISLIEVLLLGSHNNTEQLTSLDDIQHKQVPIKKAANSK